MLKDKDRLWVALETRVVANLRLQVPGKCSEGVGKGLTKSPDTILAITVDGCSYETGSGATT
jgi:hypothetical protein